MDDKPLSKPLMALFNDAYVRLNINVPSYQYRIPMLKIRRSRDRIIFNMGIPFLERPSLYWNRAQVSMGWRMSIAAGINIYLPHLTYGQG